MPDEVGYCQILHDCARSRDVRPSLAAVRARWVWREQDLTREDKILDWEAGGCGMIPDDAR
jgi:hypothetical protein